MCRLVRQSAGQPDGAVSAEGSDFENSLRSLNASQQMKELALVGSHVDGREARRRVLARDCFV